MRKKLLNFRAILLCFFAPTMFGQVTWDFATAAPTASTIPANVSVSSMTLGNTNGTVTLVTNASASTGYTGASGGNNAGNAARVGGLVRGSNGSAYFEFTVTPNQNYYVSLTGLSFGSRSTGTGPAAYTLLSSLDSYSVAIATSSLSTSGTWALRTSTGFTTTSGASTPVTFRLYGYAGTGSPGASTANWRIDDVKLTLTTQTVCGTPTAYSVTGTGVYCQNTSGLPVGLSGSNLGVTYQLKNGNTNVGIPVVGTGSAISFGNQLAGTYSVVATSVLGTCANNMTGSAVITEVALPSAFSVTGGGSYCQNQSGVLIGLSNSEVGVNYQLKNGATNVGSPIVGTGSSISFGSQLVGTYSVVATTVSGGCITNMNGSVSSTELPLPSTFSVTGGGSYCQNQGGLLVGLSNSEAGVNYQLKNGATNVGSPIAGTGSSISFGSQLAGTYSVVATSTLGSCNSDMVGNALIIENALPNVSIVGSNTVCLGFSTTLNASGANSYTWSTMETTNSITVTPTSNTNYTLTGVDNNGCYNTAITTLSVNTCGSVITSLYYCNLNINTLNYPAYAVGVSGATQYKFNFYNAAGTTLLATKTTTGTLLMLNTVSGLNYGSSYKWKVQVNTGSGFGPESVGNCTLTINTPVVTVPCNYTSSNMSTPVLAQNGGANIKSYRFTIYNASTDALIAVKTQTTNYLYLNQISGVAYGNTYKYTVEGEYYNGSSYVYTAPSSSLCTITISGPSSKLPCGNTYASTNSGYTAVPFISGVNGYKVSIYDMSSNSLVATKTYSNNYIYFNQLTGLVTNNSYYWTIECQYNNGSSNVFGAASSSTCIVTFGTPSSLVLNGNTSNNQMKLSSNDETNIEQEGNLEMTVYPNPSQGLINIDFSSINKNQELSIYNAIGQEVYKTVINVNSNQINLSALPNGIYYAKYSNVIKKIIKE